MWTAFVLRLYSKLSSSEFSDHFYALFFFFFFVLNSFLLVKVGIAYFYLFILYQKQKMY